MSFEEYLDINYNEKLDDLTKFLINDAFKAGAQSRQAEIDGLISIVETSEDSGMYLFNELQKVKKERDELQKRIDEALNKLCQLQYASAERVYIDVSKILKGQNND